MKLYSNLYLYCNLFLLLAVEIEVCIYAIWLIYVCIYILTEIHLAPKFAAKMQKYLGP